MLLVSWTHSVTQTACLPMAQEKERFTRLFSSDLSMIELANTQNLENLESNCNSSLLNSIAPSSSRGRGSCRSNVFFLFAIGQLQYCWSFGSTSTHFLKWIGIPVEEDDEKEADFCFGLAFAAGLPALIWKFCINFKSCERLEADPPCQRRTRWLATTWSPTRYRRSPDLSGPDFARHSASCSGRERSLGWSLDQCVFDTADARPPGR